MPAAVSAECASSAANISANDLTTTRSSAITSLRRQAGSPAVAWASLGADGYEEDWDRTTVGANWYFNEHAAKFQLNYRMNDNVFGVKDDDQDVYVAQMAFFF